MAGASPCARLALAALLLLSACRVAPSHVAPKPHIFLVLADDYGWANWGIHNDGSGPEGKQLQAEIHTPHLEHLAQEGVLLDRHYAFRICSPSRSSLMSGRLAMHVNWVNTGITYQNPKDPVSGFGGIPRNMTGMPAKLKEAGYATHMVGKWDAGAASPEQTPWGRGFDTFTGYLQHANDYWQEGSSFTSMGELDVCLDKFVDFSVYNKSFRGGVTPEIARELSCYKNNGHNWSAGIHIRPPVNATGCINASYCLPDSCYEESMLRQRALSIIKEHDASVPLFLFYASHLLHSPLQVPKTYLKKVDELVLQKTGRPFDCSNRRLYAAMVHFFDDIVGELVDAMKANGLWNNTLMIFTSDNGGPLYEPGSANNHPLRGGKYSDWEGGVRTNAFVSGGFVPPARRGSVHSGVVSIADWYGVVAELAGQSQNDSAAQEANKWLASHGLPLLKPVDSVPQWKHILEGTNGRPDSLYISNKAVLRYPYKLVAGDQPYSIWTGQLYPNCSTVEHYKQWGPAPVLDDVKLFGTILDLGIPRERLDALTHVESCGEGKLFNVQEDPTEQKDLSVLPAYVDILKELRADLKSFNAGMFNPDRGTATMRACRGSLAVGGYYGPYVNAGNFYTRVHYTPEQKRQIEEAEKDFDYLEKVLLPNRTKQIEWFEKNVVNLSSFFQGLGGDRCLHPDNSKSLDIAFV